MLFNKQNIPEQVGEVIENLNKNKMAGYYVDQQGLLISLLDECDQRWRNRRLRGFRDTGSAWGFRSFESSEYSVSG